MICMFPNLLGNIGETLRVPDSRPFEHLLVRKGRDSSWMLINR